MPCTVSPFREELLSVAHAELLLDSKALSIFFALEDQERGVGRDDLEVLREGNDPVLNLVGGTLVEQVVQMLARPQARDEGVALVLGGQLECLLEVHSPVTQGALDVDLTFEVPPRRVEASDNDMAPVTAPMVPNRAAAPKPTPVSTQGIDDDSGASAAVAGAAGDALGGSRSSLTAIDALAPSARSKVWMAVR